MIAGIVGYIKMVSDIPIFEIGILLPIGFLRIYPTFTFCNVEFILN